MYATFMLLYNMYCYICKLMLKCVIHFSFIRLFRPNFLWYFTNENEIIGNVNSKFFSLLFLYIISKLQSWPPPPI